MVIKAAGSLRLHDRAKPGGEQKISRLELVEAIKQKQAQNTEQPVVMAGDKSVRYEGDRNVMDSLQQQKVKKVGLHGTPP